MPASTYTNGVSHLTKVDVPLGSGLPTRDELLVHYPAKFTWNQLKTFVNSGDLGLLKRDRKLQKRYDEWAVGVKEQYGSIVNYLADHRLRWGQPDTLSLLKSSLEDHTLSNGANGVSLADISPETPPAYFSWETPKRYISIIQNDWPYSGESFATYTTMTRTRQAHVDFIYRHAVPPEIEHTLIWTKVPIFHPDLVALPVKARIEQDGLWGFTGNESPPPSPSNLPSCLPALAEWGITEDKMIKSDPPTEEDASLIERAGSEVHRYVKNRWHESKWETAWFVNPPVSEISWLWECVKGQETAAHLFLQRLQSVPGLAHIHVFARRK